MSASKAVADRGVVGLVDGAVAPQARMRKRKRFPHGNYTGYYLTRYGLTSGSAPGAPLDARDPRINLMQRSWFEGKKCLDVGCNEGDLTLALVRKFRPRRMVGVDIDGYLVQRARRALEAEVSAVADAARRRAAGDPAAGRSDDSQAAAAGMAGGAAVLRPLMPRSLRNSSGQAPGASVGKMTPRSPGRVSDNARSTGEVAANDTREGEKEVAAASRRKGDRGCGKDHSAQAKCGLPRSVDGVASRVDSSAAVGSGRVRGEDLDPAREGSHPRRGGLGPLGNKGLDVDGGARADDDATDATFLSGCAVSFWREDFVAESHDGDRGYDVVCLFSVVKWVHINGGDKAVRSMFQKTYDLLRPGGRLVLEPQPWKSYKKSARQHGSAEARANVGTIKLRPPDFPALLTEEVGFRSWEEVGVPGEGVGAFANRSVHVFVK